MLNRSDSYDQTISLSQNEFFSKTTPLELTNTDAQTVLLVG